MKTTEKPEKFAIERNGIYTIHSANKKTDLTEEEFNKLQALTPNSEWLVFVLRYQEKEITHEER